MHVIAAPGHRVPKEHDPYTYIESAPAEAVEVPDTSYYRRRIANDELLLAKKRGGAKETAQGVEK